MDDGDALCGRFDREAVPALSTEADVLKLTKRQCEVLTLLARGLSNKEIARALDIARQRPRFTWLRFYAGSVSAIARRPPSKQQIS